MSKMVERRRILRTVGLGAAALGAGLASTHAEAAAPLLPEGAATLEALTARLAKAPRRRDFKSVPMIADDKSQWDDEALREVIAYRGNPKQVWDMTAIEGPWLNLLRNTLNAQIWSFKHPDVLAVAECHSSAQLALYDETMWDKYTLTQLAGDKFKTNTLIADKPAASANPKTYEDPKGLYSPAANSIPVLMRRGVVFMACHNAIWEQAAKLVEKGLNPDKLGQDEVAADLTNHLIDGVVLTPGAVATILELQQAGFHYIK